MKKLLIGMLFTLTGCTTAHHSWMDKAFVGYVDNQAVVLFDAGNRNGVKYYRPQFQSDCHYNKYFIDEQSSTGCVINESRVSGLEPYYQHKNMVMPRSTQIVHEPFWS